MRRWTSFGAVMAERGGLAAKGTVIHQPRGLEHGSPMGCGPRISSSTLRSCKGAGHRSEIQLVFATTPSPATTRNPPGGMAIVTPTHTSCAAIIAEPYSEWFFTRCRGQSQRKDRAPRWSDRGSNAPDGWQGRHPPWPRKWPRLVGLRGRNASLVNSDLDWAVIYEKVRIPAGE
jgi:hypothetical protein